LVSRDAYLDCVKNKTLVSILNFDEVDKGDVYFIPTGRIHAIGAGVLLAEIQQTSDITYRIYDWDRKDDQGNYRELHTEEALDAIDFTVETKYSTSYIKPVNKISNIIGCQYFTTNILSMDSDIRMNNSTKDSFVIYMCVGGAGAIFRSENFEEKINIGETILFPASLDEFDIVPIGLTELLEVYIS